MPFQRFWAASTAHSASALEAPITVAGADRLVGGHQHEALDAGLARGRGDDAGGHRVVAHRLDRVLLHQRHVLVGGRVEDHRGPVLGEDLAHAGGVLAVRQHRRGAREVALLLQLARTSNSAFSECSTSTRLLGGDAGDLAAELGADGAAGSGDQHHPPAQVGAHAVDLDPHRLAAEHVLHAHLAHLTHQIEPAGEQLEGSRQRPHRDRAIAAGGNDLLAQDAGRRGDGDDHLVGLDPIQHPRRGRRSCRAPCVQRRACPACGDRRPRSRPRRCAEPGCGAARRPPAGRRYPHPRSAPRWRRARGTGRGRDARPAPGPRSGRRSRTATRAGSRGR